MPGVGAWFFALFVALAAIWPAGPAGAAPARRTCPPVDGSMLRLQSVAPGLWRIGGARGEPDAANGGRTVDLVVAVDAGRVWLVGSGPTPAFGRALRCTIEQRLGRPVSDVVNTRAAPELAMGNLAFGAARLWALPDVAAAMRRRCAQCARRLVAQIGPGASSLTPASIRPPSHEVRADRLGPFDTLALARAPGERVLVLRHRRSGVVVAQGLLWVGDVPDLRETDSAALALALHRLRDFAGAAVLLGEQGGPGDAAAIDAQLDYLDELAEAVRERLLRGDVPGDPASAVELPDFAGRPGYAERQPLNVQHVWRELEPTLFR